MSAATFSKLAEDHEILPTEVMAVVFACGMRTRNAGNACIVDDGDLPSLTTMLRRLRDAKISRRQSKSA